MTNKNDCETLREWVINQFDADEINEMAQHGASGGFTGLIYYSETTELYKKYNKDIWEMLNEDSENSGCSIFELINTFGMSKNVGSKETFENLLVWYAVENIAQNIISEKEVA